MRISQIKLALPPKGALPVPLSGPGSFFMCVAAVRAQREQPEYFRENPAPDASPRINLNSLLQRSGVCSGNVIEFSNCSPTDFTRVAWELNEKLALARKWSRFALRRALNAASGGRAFRASRNRKLCDAVVSPFLHLRWRWPSRLFCRRRRTSRLPIDPAPRRQVSRYVLRPSPILRSARRKGLGPAKASDTATIAPFASFPATALSP